jgi:hypothetical protein
VYDIGNLEMAFVTEVPRERAIATSMFKQLSQFQQRDSQAGSYYAHDVKTDGGRLTQQFCFAYAGGKLVVTTSESLMIRALAAVKGGGADSLLGDVMLLANQAKGFATHDLTIWLDQAKLTRDRLFNSYWIHHNQATGLAGMEAGLLDLRITPQGLTEQRYFKTSQSSGGQGSLKGAEAAALLKFAPADAQLVEVVPEPKADDVAVQITNSLFGSLPTVEPTRPETPEHSNTSSDSEENGTRLERYSSLDARFDADVDDDQAPPQDKAPTAHRRPASGTEAAPPAFASSISKLGPAAVASITRSSAEANRPFVHFERAVVIEMKSESGLDRAALERGIADEMRKRFIVAGVDPHLAWQDDAGVRVLGQSLLEKGAAYVVTGKYLVLASNKQLAADVAQAAASPTEAPKIDGNVSFYALVRIAAARPVFNRLMAKLDGKSAEPAKPAPKKEDQEEESDEEGSSNDIKFFSDNISSLISASTITEMRLRRESSGQLITERLVYSF